MSNPGGLRDRKKEGRRQAISNVATLLFVERGFDAVSVAQIARAAQVARKTVFNYFPRKEDLVFDREDEVRALVRAAIAARGGRSPMAAVQDLMRGLVESGHPLFLIGARPVGFWRMVAASGVLSARARELQVTLGEDLAGMLAAAVGRPAADAQARLAGGMLMATLVAAYGEGLRVLGEGGEARAAFVGVMERGFVGVGAAMVGTEYA